MTVAPRTASAHIDAPEGLIPDALSPVIDALCKVGIDLSRTIARGPLGGALGAEVGENTDGDHQKALDVMANDAFAAALKGTGVRWYASEEQDSVVALDEGGSLALAIDPLDGSSNIDVNVSIGTIFSILPAEDEAEPSFLRPGRDQIAAGYIVYGPLANGATSVMYEGSPDYPDRDRFWDVVEKYGVTILYTAPTAIRTFMRWGESYPQKHDMSSLRLLGSVGEPINPEAWIWYHENIGGGRCPVVDTWWQTETGSILIAPLPGITTLKPGSATRAFPGIEAEILDEAGNPVGPGGGGYLTIKKPWPSMLRTVYGDDERFIDQYWSRYKDIYFTADGAKLDKDGDFWLLGRVDDVINVSGHRIGTMEVESALVDNSKVAEAACIGKVHEVKGQSIVAFVTLKDTVGISNDVITELKAHVAGKIGPMARPDDIIFAAELPKTRSGKIMRRLLRDVAEGRALGDTTTLADPAVVDSLKEQYGDDE